MFVIARIYTDDLKWGLGLPATADNRSGYYAARLLYTIDLASSRAHYGTPSMEARDDVIPTNVMRKQRYIFKMRFAARFMSQSLRTAFSHSTEKEAI